MDDATLDAIDVSEFWFDDTALDADSMPVQSLDFGLLMGDVVPRDGLLLAGTLVYRHGPRTGGSRTVCRLCRPDLCCRFSAVESQRDVWARPAC